MGEELRIVGRAVWLEGQSCSMPEEVMQLRRELASPKDLFTFHSPWLGKNREESIANQ